MNAKRNLISAIVMSIALMGPSHFSVAGTTCNDNSGQGPYVCVEHPSFTPDLGTHFNLYFNDPNNPNVELLVGGEWTVWSQVSSTNTDPAPPSHLHYTLCAPWYPLRLPPPGHIFL